MVDLAPVPALSAPEFFRDVEQRSEEWFSLRLGIPTASNFSAILAEGKAGNESKMRARLLRVLAGEIITGRPSPADFQNDDMVRGIEDEPKAIRWLEQTSLCTVNRVGFIRRRLPSGRYVGCSPDGEIEGAKRIAVEIKSLRPHLWIEAMNAPAPPARHMAQCQGTCWIGGYDAVELVMFSDGMPRAHRFLVVRNDGLIKRLQDAVEIFDYELNYLVKKIIATN
jgi:YqaJ-like viral recombinase domain